MWAAAGLLRGLRGGARGSAEVPATRGPIWRSVRCAATARDPTPPRRSPSWHGPRHCGRRYRSASHRSLSASPDRPADRARRRLGATSCTVICILDPTRARARAWWRRRRPGAARCPLSTMLHLPPRFASLDRVLQGRRLCVHALAKRQGVRRLYGDFQGGYHTRGEQEQEEMRRLLLCPCASSALAFHACCLLCRACSSSPDCP